MRGRSPPRLSEITGLEPQAYLILGQGFVREEWKSLCFKEGKSVIQEAIQNPKQFAQMLVPDSQKKLMDRSARVELLRQSFKDSHLREALPLLMAHRFRPKFYDSLERAISMGRPFFAHTEEAQVFEARLNERLGFEARREEFFLLNRFWETLLHVRGLYDDHRLFEAAAKALDTDQTKLPVSKIFKLEHFSDSPRLAFFWEAVARKAEVVRIKSESLARKENDHESFVLQPKVAHSLEDAAHFLLDEVVESKNLSAQAIVIEDIPEIRRTLRRVAEERGLRLQDPRDPTLLTQSEEIKSALLELEIVARNFPIQLVLPWVGALIKDAGPIRKKLIESGTTLGLESYKMVPEVYQKLSELKLQFVSRLTLLELQKAVESSAKKRVQAPWVILALGRIFQSWHASLDQVGLALKKRPLRHWLESLNEKIKQSPPVVQPEKNKNGLKLFRVDQAISIDLNEPNLKIHFFGVTPSFFEPREQTSEWFSTRDIEVLAREFQIAGREENVKTAKNAFLSWCHLSNVTPDFWEFLYDESGNESESCDLILGSIDGIQLAEKLSLPVHPKVLPSLSGQLKEAPSAEGVFSKRNQYPVSFLNALGNCAFTAYAQHLLGLFDERETDFDLGGDSFGNLVHAAIEALVSAPDRISVEQAFQEAWFKTAKLAWLKSDRLYKALKAKTISILESFLVSEKEYRERSGASVIAQEMPIEFERHGFTFQGRVDRIDQHADGIVLMDYKTSSVLPNAAQTIESGKGLQLPAYALALKQKLNQEVVSAQYIQLAPLKTNRNVGILFGRWNKGKKSDLVEFPLSTARSNSLSLVQKEPDELWAELDQKIISLLEKVKLGQFKAEPADPADCARCRYALVCGRKRGMLA